MEKRPRQHSDVLNKLEQFRKSASSDDETEDESLAESSPASGMAAARAVSTGADLDAINQPTAEVDTSHLADVGHLVDAGLVDKVAGSEQLDALLGDPQIVTSDTAAASSGVSLDVLTQSFIPGGNAVHVYPDGSVLTGTAPGVGVVHTLAGTVEHVVVQPGGVTVHQDIDGTSIRTIDGTVVTHGPEGVTTTSPGGMETTTGHDGSTTTVLPDGTTTGTGGSGGSTGGDTGGSSGNDSGQSGQSDPSGQPESGGESGSDSESDDKGDHDDDDDSSTEPETTTETESDDSGDDSGSDSPPKEEGTPNPMNEETGGPPIWLVTNGRLGQQEQSNTEKAIDVVTGAGHTTPVEEESGSSLEFLTSPVGQEQVKQDMAAIEQAKTGGITDPSGTEEESSGIPTEEDIANVEFIVSGGGVVDPALADISSVATKNLQLNLETDDIKVEVNADEIEDIDG